MLDVLSDNGPASLLETLQTVCRIGATQIGQQFLVPCMRISMFNVRSSQNFISHERKKMKEVRRR